MTIKIINVPEGEESHLEYLTGVKGVSDTEVMFYSGFNRRKHLCAKVDIVSLMDADEKANYTEYTNFFKSLGIEKSGGEYVKMSRKDFANIDLPTCF